MSFRITLKTIIFSEFVICLTLVSVLIVFPVLVKLEGLTILPSFLAVSILFHLPLAYKKGWGYIIRDEDQDSIYKYYWYLGIFVSAFMSPILAEALQVQLLTQGAEGLQALRISG